MNQPNPVGATRPGNGETRFRVWAPHAERMELLLADERIPMERRERGWFETSARGAPAGTRYRYALHTPEGVKERPDPASRFQPEGPHGPSEVVDPSFEWTDAGWPGLRLRDYIVYELHVGTFTKEGTFRSAIQELPRLKSLGVTAIEIMPVAQFPGDRNWGYDGTYPFAVQNSYGGPRSLKELVDACHAQGLAVVLDVVYNHLGPEGSYFQDFGPYFTDRYRTPWGMALNFDGPGSDAVREYFIQNARMWVSEFHVDALRLDAVHAIYDLSGHSILEEIAESVADVASRTGRQIQVIAESDLNDARLIRPREVGGLGLAAVWSDDFHHSLRTLVTGDRNGYYQDYGRVEQLAKAFREGFVFNGVYSGFRQRRLGTRTTGLGPEQFVVCSQNHDQVGNRMLGERLPALTSFEALKLAAGAVLLSPFTPLLFMGEEYAEKAPFQYFVSHTDPGLVDAVREGRKREFAQFFQGGASAAPDPQSEDTFRASKLDPQLAREDGHREMFQLYQELIRIAKWLRRERFLDRETMSVETDGDLLLMTVTYTNGSEEFEVIFNFNREDTELRRPLHAGSWVVVLDSAEERWNGPGSLFPGKLRGMSFVAIRKESE